VTLYPASVQGAAAPGEIVRALRAFSRVPGAADVVIVARGGGSKEDLAAFNDEAVVRAVAASRVPVVSAVGHEVDVTLTDLAADLRAATPSQAAELVVERLDRFEERLARGEKDLKTLLKGRVDGAVHEISRLLSGPAFAGFSAAAAPGGAGRPARVAAANEKLGVAAGRLEALSPLRVLARGYAIVTKEGEAAPVTDAAILAAGDAVRVRLARGRASARILSTETT